MNVPRIYSPLTFELASAPVPEFASFYISTFERSCAVSEVARAVWKALTRGIVEVKGVAVSLFGSASAV